MPTLRGFESSERFFQKEASDNFREITPTVRMFLPQILKLKKWKVFYAIEYNKE